MQVKVEIVQEQDDVKRASPYSSPTSSAASSSVSVDSVDSDVPENETFAERLAALKDIVPPTTRHNIANKLSASGSFLKRSSKVVGNIVWVLTTSALLVGLPMALSLEGEAAVIEQEKAMLAQGGQQVRTNTDMCRIASSYYYR